MLQCLTERVSERTFFCIKDEVLLPSFTCAASLAYHGLLGSVNKISLHNVNLTSIPEEHLTSIISSVTKEVDIRKVRGCDLVSLLDSVKSQVLRLRSQSLGSEETRALVRAMESRVESVTLNKGVTLDIRILSEYSGKGKCNGVRCYDDTARRYNKKLTTWATSKNWEARFGIRKYFVPCTCYYCYYWTLRSIHLTK